MASELPTFHHHGCGLTPWEALFDRGIGIILAGLAVATP